MKWKRLIALALACALPMGLLSGCELTQRKENVSDFQVKADTLRTAALSDQVRDWLEEDPAGEAGYAVFFSVCDGKKRAAVYSGSGDTPDDAWDAAEESAEEALDKGGPFPLWVKADVVYISAVLSAEAMDGIGEVFGAGGFRYGLAFDPMYETALLEGELNTAGILDYENGGVDTEILNDYLEETGRAALDTPPDSYTAFQCAGWLCDETGAVVQLGLDNQGYGRRVFSAVDSGIAAALALDGAEYMAEQVQEDGRIILPGGETLSIPRHAEALSAMIRGYRLNPSENLAESIDRAAEWLVGQIAYTKQDIGFLMENGEITLENCALSLIALADCEEASGNTAYFPVCQALGSGLLSLLNSDEGIFTHVLDASDLSRKELFRSEQWDGMGVTALCRLYGMTEDPLWLWAAEQVLNRMLTEESACNGELWTAYAVREITKYVQDGADYYIYALKNAKNGMAAIYSASGTEAAGLEMLTVSYEIYHKMLDDGYSVDGFAPELLLEVISARALRQLDGYLFPEYAMYFAEPQKVLGAFMDREDGLSISAEAICRNIGGYSLYSADYDSLMADGMAKSK